MRANQLCRCLNCVTGSFAVVDRTDKGACEVVLNGYSTNIVRVDSLPGCRI